MQAALEWYDWNARNGVTPENNTAMSWDEIQSAFKQEKAFAYHHGVFALPEWQLGDAKGATWPTDEEGYFEKIGWIHAPAPEAGGEPANLSHPIVYVVNPQCRTPSWPPCWSPSPACPTTTPSTRSARRTPASRRGS